jgi:ParB-like chromosome segregation protein Spo0J
MKVEQINIEKLIPYVNNARTHSDDQVTQIASSIREFGFNNPILVDEQYGIIAGHGRLMAGKKLGLETVPCIMLKGLTESQRKAYIIADNKIALNSGWDEELLKIELMGLTDAEQVATGFNADELNLLFNAWSPDIDIPDNSDMDTRPVLKFKIEKDQEEFAKEVITNALDDAGIEYERL